MNENYTDTVPMEPSYSSLGHNYYDTVTTINKGIGEYDVLVRNKPKPASPPPVMVEASKGGEELCFAESHMYAANIIVQSHDVLVRNKPKPASPPPVTVEARKGGEELCNVENYMYEGIKGQ